MSRSSIVKNSIVIMILTVISKITGFFRDLLVASAYGTTYETDAYNISLSIPTLIFAVIGMAIPTILIPIFCKLIKEQGKEKMYDFANKLLIILFCIICSAGLIIFFNMEFIISIVAPNVIDSTAVLAVKLTKISIVSLLFLSIYSIFYAILQSMQEFIPCTIVGLVLNIPIIVYVLLEKNLGIYGLTIVNVVGYALQVLIQLPWLIKHKYKFKISLNFRDKLLAKIPILLLPTIIGSGINQINIFVDQIVASGLEEGTISAVNLSSKINTIVYGIYGLAIITSLYPILASEIDKMKEFKNHISKGICNIFLVMFPYAIGMMILSREIVIVMFQRGIFDENSVRMTSESVFFLTVGIVFYGIKDLLCRAFYVMEDTFTPMRNGVGGVVVNIILDIILTRYMGIGGLSLATSISAIATALLSYTSLRKRIGSFLEIGVIFDLLKICISSVLMGIYVYIMKVYVIQYMSANLTINLLFMIITGGIVYFVALKILKTAIFEENLNRVSNKIKLIYCIKNKKNNKHSKMISVFSNKDK